MMERWPRLDYQSERPVYETVHAYCQVIGKLPVRSARWLNHSWHVALRVTPTGFRTHSLPSGGQEFELLFDCLEGEVSLLSSDGATGRFAVAGKTVAGFQQALDAILGHCGIDADISGAPNEVAEAVPFARDERERPWNADAVRRLHGAFRSADRVFRAFRTGFLGKSSPSHLFWGSFDLAVTRFSGRRAPPHPGGFPNLDDRVTREAYSHELISAGFWPGGGDVGEAAFYAYAYPTPDGLAGGAIRPEPGRWSAELGEFILPYAAVREAVDPDDALLSFLQSSYAAAADLAGWDRAALDTPLGKVGKPRKV
ncbi:DUF5996 family protein [Novosphingopyxis sp.]|uniref:DUF5996 family protein n=1 Tax=Novosphingopyxis sp. TaxID=2709690 RepID=UPI003B5BC04F